MSATGILAEPMSPSGRDGGAGPGEETTGKSGDDGRGRKMGRLKSVCLLPSGKSRRRGCSTRGNDGGRNEGRGRKMGRPKSDFSRANVALILERIRREGDEGRRRKMGRLKGVCYKKSIVQQTQPYSTVPGAYSA